MPHVKTTVDIAASPAQVWAILSDLSAYPAWNPLIVGARGWLDDGAPLDLEVAVGRTTTLLGTRVLRVRPGEELRWHGPRSSLLRRLLCGEHYFVLESLASGCRLVHGEIFSGLASGLVPSAAYGRLGRAYDSMNQALKRRAESELAQPTSA